ncbi:MAG: ATP-binding protein [Clostridia bacterium]
MKIKNIKINSYGNLKQKEINLENNINIIYGKNESGKSTLLNYLKNIFYGISKNKNGKEISDYEKYLPWIGEEFSGKIKYELNNKNIFEIYRDFKKKSPKIFNEYLEDISDQFKIDKKDGNQFFYEQTGIDEKTYSSTIMTAQQEVVLDNQSQNILIQKLANYAGTGDDKVSYQKALDKLNKRLVEEVGTNRTQDRPLNLVQDKIKKIEFDLKANNKIKKYKEEIENKKQILEENLEEENKKNNILNKLNLLFNKYKIELEKNNLKNKIKNEDEEKLKNKIEEKNNLIKNIKLNPEKNKLNKKINYFIIILFLLIILNIFNFILIKNKIINYLILSLIPIEIIIYFIKNKKTKKDNKKLEKELNEKIIILDSQINLLKENINKNQEEINNEKNKILFNFNLEKEKIEENNFNFKIEDIEKELENSNKKIMEYQLQLNSIKYEENNINEKLEKLISDEEQYEELKEQLNILEEKNKCILATKDLLEKAYEKMKNNVTPKFTQNLSNIVKSISNGKYTKVIFNEENGLIVELENGEYISANRLSVGTIDQLYLSLRLSMINEISEEKMPIILDEAFAYFDDERLKNSLLFLIEQSKEHQLIIFTCSHREEQILNELNIDYNLVEL